MLEIGDYVKCHNGKVGSIIRIYPAGILDSEIIYQVLYDAGMSGQFREVNLTIIDKEILNDN